MARITVIGADGQLGSDVVRALGARHEVTPLAHQDIEITDERQTRERIASSRPEIVINTAALTKTEFCETHPVEAFAVNAAGAYHVARAARAGGAQTYFISTDYVFDGSREYFTEDDCPAPLNVYGSSKLGGEYLTRIGDPRAVVIRTSWLYGARRGGKGYNFVSLMIEKANAGEPARVVNDQFGSPTATADLALGIAACIEKRIPPGTYHMTNGGTCSWYEFAREIFFRAGAHASLVPISSAESGSAIARPRHSTLKSVRLAAAGIAPLRPWQEALRAHLDEIKVTR